MDDAARDFFRQAILTPSPSGYEEPIQRLIAGYIRPHADDVRTDVHGNLIASLGGPPASPSPPGTSPDGPAAGRSIAANDGVPRLMYAGHCDQIGMLVSHIDENGFVYGQTVGGWDPQQLIGQSMTIWTENGGVAAVISRKPIHLLNQEERNQVVKLEQMWLDIGAKDEQDAREKVRIGDCVTLDLRLRNLLGDLVSGPGMDNKSGMWTVIESLRRVAQGDTPLSCHLHSVATVQEEIGLRGAKTAAGSINPDVAIAVDVTHASDCPTIDKQQQGDIAVGRGPVIFRGPNINPKVSRRLVELCETHGIPYQLAALGRAAPNDSNALQLHGGGVATGLVAIPNRYMHSAVEVVSMSDLDAIAELLKHFALSLSPDDSFIPG